MIEPPTRTELATVYGFSETETDCREPPDGTALLTDLICGRMGDSGRVYSMSSQSDCLSVTYKQDDSDAVVYVNYEPYSVQVYPDGTEGPMADTAWRNLRDLVGEPRKAVEQVVAATIRRRIQ